MADRILVLEKGASLRMARMVIFDGLLPLYRELYNKQQMVAEEEGGASC